MTYRLSENGQTLQVSRMADDRFPPINETFEVGEPVHTLNNKPSADKIWWIREFKDAKFISEMWVGIASERGGPHSGWERSSDIVKLNAMLRLAVEAS